MYKFVDWERGSWSQLLSLVGEVFSFSRPGQALRSHLQRWCWSAWRPSLQMALSSLCPSWPSGWHGPGQAYSSCCACVCTTVSSPWWTSTTAPCWPTSPCLLPTARASTSTAPCSAPWAPSRFSSPTLSGTRKISTPSVFSAWLWQLFPFWAFLLCRGFCSSDLTGKSVQNKMRRQHLKSKRLETLYCLGLLWS